MEINRNKKKKGFSLIEVILALFVLTVGIGAVMSLMGANMANSIRNRDAIVATQLAQEGAELIRGEDKNGEITSPAGNYKVDIDADLANGLLDAAAGSDPYLLYEKSGTRLYAHSGATPAKFRRKITRGADAENTQQYSVKVWWGGELDAPADCSLATKCVGESLYVYGEQDVTSTPPPSPPPAGTCDVATSPVKDSIACAPYSIGSHIVDIGESITRIDYAGGREEETYTCVSNNTWGSLSSDFVGGQALDVTQWTVSDTGGFYDEVDCS